MSNLEIQREAIIEIVGTQYEGRADNHKYLKLKQRLVMKRQDNNPHDINAILFFTEDNKELGFMPKGYASLYAPAMDSGKYDFTAEIVKTEADSDRPILIVKILSEYKNLDEHDVESTIIDFVQNISANYKKSKIEYLSFVLSETVNVDDLLFSLNNVRLIHKLYALSKKFIDEYGIDDNVGFKPFTRESLLEYISNIRLDLQEILKRIQKTYNESIDIEDETEYQRVQSEAREKKNKFRSLDGFCDALFKAVENYIPIVLNTSQTEHDSIKSNEEITNNLQIHKSDVSEQSYPPKSIDANKVTKDNCFTDSELEEKIIEVIRQNKNNLQYADGFGTYEIKNLLANNGVYGVSEDDIDKFMSLSGKLREVEKGYYVYNEEDARESPVVSEIQSVIVQSEDSAKDISEKPMLTDGARRIVLELNGKIIRAYDCSDALCKICEFAIRVKPFDMARTASEDLKLNDKLIFCRSAVPVDGYIELSNGLQVLNAGDISSLNDITNKIKAYCHIKDDMIKIISR